jgi:hypothetical protein
MRVVRVRSERCRARALAVRDERLQARTEDAAEFFFECVDRGRGLHLTILVDRI